MRRLLVIGSPAAGKSTFAHKLAESVGLPLIHLDAEYHLPGWIEPEEHVWDARLDELLAGESWIIDGNFGSSLKCRLARADTVCVLDYPTILCLWRVVKRITSLHGRVRPDAAPGCPEDYDWGFLHYIADFRRRKRPGVERDLATFTGEIVRFRRPSDAHDFLDRLA